MLSHLLRRNAETQVLTKRGDRKNVFRIRRFKNDHGFYVYALENSAESKKIFIPRFVFGKFRACVRAILQEERAQNKTEPFERSVSFLNRDYFYFKSSRMDLDNLIIQDLEERQGSTGYITVGRKCLDALDALLYSDALAHPNDVLESIISYHKLFQFSFVKGSKSITSELALRKDVMQRTINYRPNLAERVPTNDTPSSGRDQLPPSRAELKTSTSGGDHFKTKLGERFHEKDIRVDYGEIFGDKKVLLGKSQDPEAENKASTKGTLLQFAVPLSTEDVKTFGDGKFSFELSVQRSNEFRNQFVGDRASDFYLGFEIVDSLFTHNKTLKSFQFPLYYTRVKIRESGRAVYLESVDDGRIYLNHLALAQLVDKFSKKTAGVDSVDAFFKTLLAQHISIDQLNDRITLTRHLPVNGTIFDRTREVLFGYADDNGKGGILGDLKFNGVECDLHSVNLYRAPRLLAPLDQALEHDLDSIHVLAHQKMSRFYDSLLGRFLTPELQSSASEAVVAEDNVWVPGCLPKSTRTLFNRLSRHDMVLLEGPPGTGKTFTILNLLIHHVCLGKRVLIVSDQRGAIEALVEKIDAYVASGAGSGNAHKDLIFNALKIIDDVDVSTPNLADVVERLARAFKTQDVGTASSRKNLDKKFVELNEKIQQLTTTISKKMHGHMTAALNFESIEPHKNESSSDLASLIEFLSFLLDEKNSPGNVIEHFINHRRELVKKGMESLYPFFNLPPLTVGESRIAEYIQSLRDDQALLQKLARATVTVKEEFVGLVGAYPRHELLCFLETVFERQSDNPEGGFKRVAKKITAAYRTPLQKHSQTLLEMVENQIAILESATVFSGGLWRLLRESHECIRLDDRPTQALALFYRIVSARDSGVRDTGGSILGDSIQADLEKIDDLVQQRDRLVYERFIVCLYDITRRATSIKRGAATDASTRIMSLVEDMKQFNSIAESGAVFDEFKQALYDAFPIWIVRKQTVPLLLPCTEQSFDLVIIDEATQCRVDDAMSLLFRAKKLLVVGDDKQTVLQKNSSTDDYLFKDHELGEHLRSTQARGFKGGGSHIFALVKSIKQASVMLDEHYRCPAQIIEFSNHYVYDDELKVMQWRLPEQASPVFVDDSEFQVATSKKATSGKFKSIEIEMVDRFFDYVEKTLRSIERETGEKINLETDVALCYFLMKNEPYVKHRKESFLSGFKRGETLLDGAGAALQGKERNYIFYLWDVTRYNLAAFTQGDDEDKRKGELNVLMSRPKKKAFHFLHRNFEQLEHSRSNITHYLWRTLLRQRQEGDLERTRMDNEDASLFLKLLTLALDTSKQRGIKETRHQIKQKKIEFRADISVGDALKVVDLIAFDKGSSNTAVGLINLGAFAGGEESGGDVIDYYFQLKRAVPNIDPVFLFPYELLNDNSKAFRSLVLKLGSLETL